MDLHPSSVDVRAALVWDFVQKLSMFLVSARLQPASSIPGINVYNVISATGPDTLVLLKMCVAAAALGPRTLCSDAMSWHDNIRLAECARKVSAVGSESSVPGNILSDPLLP